MNEPGDLTAALARKVANQSAAASLTALLNEVETSCLIAQAKNISSLELTKKELEDSGHTVAASFLEHAIARISETGHSESPSHHFGLALLTDTIELPNHEVVDAEAVDRALTKSNRVPKTKKNSAKKDGSSKAA